MIFVGACNAVTGNGVKGVYKVFVALGKEYIQAARSCLEDSSEDKLLQNRVNDLEDNTIVLRPLKVLTSREHCATEMDEGSMLLQEVAQKGSPAFKENCRVVIDEFVNLALDKAKQVTDESEKSITEWLNELLQAEPGGPHYDALVKKHTAFNKEFINQLGVLALAMLGPVSNST